MPATFRRPGCGCGPVGTAASTSRPSRSPPCSGGRCAGGTSGRGSCEEPDSAEPSAGCGPPATACPREPEEGNKEMFYLMMHSTHLRFYMVRHHRDNERKSAAAMSGLFVLIGDQNHLHAHVHLRFRHVHPKTKDWLPSLGFGAAFLLESRYALSHQDSTYQGLNTFNNGFIYNRGIVMGKVQ